MDVCIIDEADYVLEEKSFIFMKQENDLLMNGVYRAFRAKNLILMSARFNEQQQRFLTQAFGVQKD